MIDSQGRFHVRRELDGRVRIEMPPIVVVPPEVVIDMASAMLKMAGAQVIFADEGQTVIRGPAVIRGNGAKVVR